LGRSNASFTSVFLKSELLRNSSILISGTAIAQLIPILLQPILRRYFSPEIFGAYSVYQSLVGILLIVSSFRYELAIILPKKESEAISVFYLAILLNAFFNFFLLVIIIFWKAEILRFLNLSGVFGNYLYLVPVGTFLFSTYQSINYWLIRKKSFIPISINKFVRRGFEGASQVGFKFVQITNGLVYGDLIGQFANVVSGLYQAGKKGLSLRLFSIQKVQNVSIKYSEYPKFNLVPSFMSACSYLLPALLITKFYTTENTGYFDLSKLLLSIPLALISTSLSQVLLQRITEKGKTYQSIRRDLLGILWFVLLIVIFEIVIITFWSEDLFRIFFGEKWIYSGTISKTLVWAYGLNFFVSSFSSIFISLKKIKLLSAWQFLYFVSILSLFLFRNLSFTSFIRVYVLIEVICSIVITIFMIGIVINYEKKIPVRVKV
jgi:O-antigen/teichoic acid export membrane protein